MSKEIGKKYGRWRILKFIKTTTSRTTYFLCECDCGVIKRVSRQFVRSGKSKSCGCLHKELLKINPPATKHGNKRKNKVTVEYRTWSAMIERCTNKNYLKFHRYGGRGISVCKKWLKFENFLKDMGKKPKNTTLERVNNDKGYSKKNCKWATTAEQNKNRSTTSRITWKGETHCISDWEKFLGFGKGCLYYRLKIAQWGVEKSFTTKSKHYVSQD